METHLVKDTLIQWDRKANAREMAEREEEVWVESIDTPRYWVSNLGRVLSFARLNSDGHPTLMSLRADVGKYPSVGLYLSKGDKQPLSYLLHRLVLRSFEGEPSVQQTDCRHLNLDVNDARLCNLAWGTRSDNMKDVWGPQGKVQQQSRVKREAKRANPTYGLDESLLTRLIALFEQGSIRLNAMAGLLGCSEEVARSALVGITWPHLNRNMDAIDSYLGREGEKHYKAIVSDTELISALKLYVENHWSSNQFAAHLGMSQVTAHSILSGRTRNNIGRPPGFVYPWPDMTGVRLGSQHGMALIDEGMVESMFSAFMEGKLKNLIEISAYLGLSEVATREIMKGQKWGHVPRPEGFDEKWRNTMRFIFTPEQRELIPTLMDEGKSDEEIMAIVGCPSTKTLQPYRTEFKKRNGVNHRWSEEEKTILAELVKSGMTAAEINHSGKLPGRKVDGTAVMRAKRAIKAEGAQ